LVLVGYLWAASHDDADLIRQQKQALLELGVADSQIYEDIGVPRQERPNLEACLQALQAGDTLVVWQLDRLVNGRSQLLQRLQDLWERNIGLKILAGQGSAIDSTQLSLKVVLDILGALSELENQIVREATLEGLAAARARGQILGPRRKMTAEMIRRAMADMTGSNLSVTQIAAKLGITRATIYLYLNGDGSPKPKALEILQAAEED
jgi:DNA invertase Pin-like site-specific DNA recombinase